MESYKIIYGFADIKRQLIKKHNLNKAPNELDLWFSFENDVLFAHDFDEHEKCMAMAIWDHGLYKCYLNEKDYSIPVFEYAVRLSMTKQISTAKVLNDLYDLHGTRPFRQ